MTDLSISLQPFAVEGPAPVEAPLLWNWNYTGNGINAGGTLLTTSYAGPGGYYQITGISGFRNGDAITGLEPAGDAIPGNAGYPVDDLITASGLLTVNGFGYEMVDGSFSNPYYANYLSPAIYQEVYTAPASSGFAELPITFKAAIVPGVTIATAAPGVAAASLALQVIRAPENGTLSLDGTSVQYDPASQSLLTLVTFSFALIDSAGVAPVVTVIADGAGSQSVSGAMSGYSDISLGSGNSSVKLHGTQNTVTIGNGNQSVSGGGSGTVYVGNGNSTISLGGGGNTAVTGNGNYSVTAAGGDNTITVGNGNSRITLGGGGNTVTTGNGNQSVTLGGSGSAVTLGNGSETVHGGTGDSIHIAGGDGLTIYGNNEMVFVANGDTTINDLSTGLDIRIGPSAGSDTLLHFAADLFGVVDLIGGIGGFKTVAEVLSALGSDGEGGALLAFGNGGSLDFVDVAPSQLRAANFRIG